MIAGLKGVTLTEATLTGVASAVGVFDSLVLSQNVQFGPGILLTSGKGSPERVNNSSSQTTVNFVPGDADLTNFAQAAFSGSGSTIDATVLTLTFFVTDPNVKSIKFDVAFGSEEYPEFADSTFVDIAAIWTGTGMTAVNYALVNGDPTTPLATITKNVSLGNFFDNAGGGLAIQYDGLILNQTIQVPVTLGLNIIKIGVADTGDSALDSGLFITGISTSGASGGGTLQNVDVTIPGGKYSGANNNFIFKGNAQNLNNSVIEFFDDLDQIFVDGAVFNDFGVNLDFGSLILNIDTNQDGISDTKITLEDPIPNATVKISQENGGTGITLVKLAEATNGDDSFTGDDGLQYLSGGNGNDNLSGLGGSDVLVGDAGNDVLTGGAGNDEIQGGTGTDTAVFSGKRIDYKVEKQGDGSIKVVDIRAGSPDGTDFVTDVENFQFSDGTLDAVKVLANPTTPTPAPSGVKSYVSGKAGNDHLKAVASDKDGTHLFGQGGNDILRGGKFDDLLVGGKGDDQMFGGAGADQFRLFGNQIDGASDRDRIFDLNFGEGDVLVFGSFASNTFTDASGVNAYTGGTSATINSFLGLVQAAGASNDVTALRASPFNDNLLLKVTNADGQVQEILISNGWTQFVSAGGTDGL
jgi:hypothetical protein